MGEPKTIPGDVEVDIGWYIRKLENPMSLSRWKVIDTTDPCKPRAVPAYDIPADRIGTDFMTNQPKYKLRTEKQAVTEESAGEVLADALFYFRLSFPSLFGRGHRRSSRKRNYSSPFSLLF